ncbi:MAG TPA: hypothetical protein VE907_21880 [Gammaproteobacteria bacterium]|nr:hypothetical protein [Gammaproteobacteria bacterium]
MARLEWVIITERTIVEAQTGSVSLQSIVETILLAPPTDEPQEMGKKLLIPFRFYVNLQVVREDANRPERPQGRALLKGPDGKTYMEIALDVNLETHVRARVIGLCMGFPFLGAGEYPIVIQFRSGSRWRTIGRTQFAVAFTPQPPATGVH